MSALALLWIIPLMIVMLLLKGFFSGTEIALVHADKIRLSHQAKQGDRGAALVLRLEKRPEQLLTTTLVGTNLSTIVFTTLGTLIMIHFFGDQYGDLYAFLLFTPMLLILGEIVPKSVYQQRSNEVATVVIYPLRVSAWVLFPIVFVFSRIARIAAWAAGGRASAEHMFTTREQLHSLIQMAEKTSDATVFDRFRLERAVRFPDMTVGQQMVPVGEIVAIASDKSMARVIRLASRRGLNRIPVYEGDSSNVVGIVTLTTWDLLDPRTAEKPIEELMRPAHYVSPHDSLVDLLPVLRGRDDGMAIVVDEYGSTVGLITMDNIVEAVVGEVEVGYEFEEYVPREVREYEELEDGSYIVDGRLPIHEINDVFGLNLPSTEYHTIGGFLVAKLRHLAKPGDAIEEAGYRFTVLEASDRSIKKVRVDSETFHRG